MSNQPIPVRVLVVDDQTIVRKGTRALLDLIDDIDVVGEACNGAHAIELAAALQPNVVLMDLVMPEIDGVAATEHIVNTYPHIHVIALTSFGTDDKLLPMVRAGALGYLLKDADTDALVQAIRQVARGEPWLPPEMARRVLAQLRTPETPSPRVDPLTDRELAILKLLAKGCTNAYISTQLNISDATVRTHISHIFDKLHCTNRVQAVLYALRCGLASLEETP
ncbi:MAG: response regulator transcription factor [Caldilineaceae bacterium]|jgi:NarL family two-component system response regulator LiaR|nr:response regulator transcription factor [Caldilineaceae bacterium]